jgi:hypothetical protein
LSKSQASASFFEKKEAKKLSLLRARALTKSMRHLPPLVMPAKAGIHALPPKPQPRQRRKPPSNPPPPVTKSFLVTFFQKSNRLLFPSSL